MVYSTQWVLQCKNLYQQNEARTNHCQLTVEYQLNETNVYVNNVKQRMIDIMVQLTCMIGMLDSKLCGKCNAELATIGNFGGFGGTQWGCFSGLIPAIDVPWKIELK